MPPQTYTTELPSGADAERQDSIRFCSRCGEVERESSLRPETRRRVCSYCGMGVMLSAWGDALPGSGAAFLIVTADLAIGAVSRAGDKIFGPEDDLVGTHVLDVVTSPVGDHHVEHHARRAAQRRCETVALPVRLIAGDAPPVGTLSARIATCGAPRAALLAVEPSGFGIR